MRRLIPLVLVVSACTGTAEDTTSVPIAEPSTTTSTAPATTTPTTEPTTTTTAEECTERDGVLRNRRGFVCPPHLIAIDMVAVGGAETAIHLAGTYETRLFTPPLRFTRHGQFSSPGENTHDLGFDISAGPVAPYMGATSGDGAVALATWPDLKPVNRPDDWTWTEDMEISETEVDGFPATVTTFTANCLDETKAANAEECFFTYPGLGDGVLYSFHGERTAVIVLDMAEPLTITVGADARAFDSYWEDTARPILDSIEFLDP